MNGLFQHGLVHHLPRFLQDNIPFHREGALSFGVSMTQ